MVQLHVTDDVTAVVLVLEADSAVSLITPLL